MLLSDKRFGDFFLQHDIDIVRKCCASQLYRNVFRIICDDTTSHCLRVELVGIAILNGIY